MADPGATSPKKEKKTVKKREDELLPSELPRSGPRGTSPVLKPAQPPQRASTAVTVVVGGATVAEGSALIEAFCNGPAEEKKKVKKTTSKAVKDDFEPRTIGVSLPEAYRREGDPAHVALSVAVCDSPTDVGGLSAADCVLLCYAPALPNSLEEAQSQWVRAVREAAPRAAILLCGTRVDHLEKSKLDKLKKQAGKSYKEVSLADALKAAASSNLNGYLEASTKNNKGVKHAVQMAALLGFRARKGGSSVLEVTKELEESLKASRGYIKLPPYKPRWKIIKLDSGGVRYYDRETRRKIKKRPPDFDGEDWVQKEQEEEKKMIAEADAAFRQVLTHRGDIERGIARTHAERCGELGRCILLLQEETTGLECKSDALYIQQKQIAEDKVTLTAQLEKLEADIQSET
eukprot:Hpha_TRINITY_DN26799_c0_g1::TRINITY_DN26799_c0_g1_i1::g.138978::m.138978